MAITTRTLSLEVIAETDKIRRQLIEVAGLSASQARARANQELKEQQKEQNGHTGRN